jgi:zinc transport system permease protein
MHVFWLDQWLDWLASQCPDSVPFSSPSYAHGFLAVLLVSLICGAVGSLVVANRMAFFSDALAHCAFAGVGVGLLFGLACGLGRQELEPWIPYIMAVFGILVGLGIALVQDKTALASDTVIGVFFAGAIGFGAVLLQFNARRFLNPEGFLFGDLVLVTGREIMVLFVLALITIGFMIWMNNPLVFSSFNPSLARSRRIPVRLCTYLFIALLGIIVNLCIPTIGALLINALLIVPAATASNLCRNMRQMFWCSIVLCLFAGVCGQWLSWQVMLATAGGIAIHPGESGSIVVVSVVLFFVSMIVGPRLKNGKPARLATSLGPALAERAPGAPSEA